MDPIIDRDPDPEPDPDPKPEPFPIYHTYTQRGWVTTDNTISEDTRR